MKTLLWALCAGALVTSAAAQAQVKLEKPKLSIASTNPVISYYPFEIALAKGYFKDEGLDVERSIFAGGSQTTKALVGGSTDMIVSAYSNTLTMATKGINLQAVVLMIKYPGFVFGITKKAMPKYKSLQDLSGMVIGVTAPGSSTNFILNSIATRNGVNPKSYSVIGVGAQAGAAAAVREGQLDALVGIDPIITMLVDSGDFKILADLRTGPGTLAAVGADTYPEGSLIATADFIKKNPNTVQAVVNAMVRADKFLATATNEQIADALPKSYQVGTRAQYLSAIEHTRTIYSPDGRYDAKGAEAVLGVLAGSDAEIAQAQKKIDMPATYTNKFVDAAVVKTP
ncbi:MAG TPA: ABC transporter substrate-binding protein [Burkholderiaceae bacterium]|jgi:NitT/TauT family transport system substrate-binding protein